MDERGEMLAMSHFQRIRAQTDRVFAGLMVVQFIAGVLAAVFISPRTWMGSQSAVHVHVYAAVGIGLLLASLPIYLAITRPGEAITRHVVAVSQVLYSALFIHLSGGRIETHFHVFGSLALLAIYRDWKVLVPATLVVAADHMLRAVLWPESVFGVITAAPWRAVEHAGWVLFEDAFLLYSCVRSAKEVRLMASRQARLENVNAHIEQQIAEGTAALEERTRELEREMHDRQMLEAQLVQSQKLESIGQLAAGVAHEINTPAQYVSDNTRFLQEQFEGIIRVLDQYAAQMDANAPAKSWNERVEETRALLEEVDYDFIRSEIPEAISQSLEGLERITTIVKAMMDFSHPGSEIKEPVDINQAIRSTVTVCKNRWKYAADLELDLADDLPDVPCHVAEFNQVILNLVVNAGDAIQSHLEGQDRKGLIKVSTRLAGDCVEVRVTDNGGGIPEDVQQKVFDPFFTTKEVGKGTGQGLAISRNVVVEKHGGELLCESEPGVGTTFVVRIPLQDEQARECAA